MRAKKFVSAFAVVCALAVALLMLTGVSVANAQDISVAPASITWARYGFGGGLDNDVFVQGFRSSRWGANTDRYYTSAEGAHGFLRIGGPNSLWPLGFTKFLELRIAQAIFTPDAIELAVPDPSDRQYAGVFTGALSYTFASPWLLARATLEMGMVGPHALGEEFQNFFHRNVACKPEARGWSYQLPDRWVTNIGADLLYRLPLFSGQAAHGSIVFNMSATAGNLLVQAAGGASLRVGFGEEVHRFGRPQVSRGTPGSLITATTASGPWYRWFGIEFFAGVRGLATAWDVTLDAGRSVERVPFGGSVSFGTDVLLFRYFRLSYEVTTQSPEFRAQDGVHAYASGYLSFVWQT